ncbi:IclR family transcriptional regulator [Amycolatopsis pithecellobii]|uniref:Glycerol operon regulatory protein n=1 Tax=Amycolatopsis pithecellobii TaxID=664692 RepID=A0A6N7YWC3_9PSEU|nr:IclR family transcriptional regulator [Amycolatopsis pithecellobii]MTD53173.1 helix-turn-helix domain-containing protein [Amycolatopsis pithecellobii]
MLGSIVKASRVLGLFTPLVPEWGVSDVATELRIPKSSAHSLLDTLTETGLVRRTPRGRYRLGWRILELNRSLMLSTEFLTGRRDRIRLLAEDLGATVHIAALRGHEVVCLDEVTASRASGRSGSRVGRPIPAHSTAMGKVLLAFTDARRQRRVVEQHGLKRCTEYTQTELRGLREELALTRIRGYGSNLQETRMDVCCVAAPLRDAAGATHAALSVSLPPAEFGREQERIRHAVLRLAASLSGKERQADDR